MVVDLLGFLKMDDHTTIQEATSQGLRSMEHLICFMSNRPNHMDCSDLIDHIVAKFKKVISLLTGPITPGSGADQFVPLLLLLLLMTPSLSLTHKLLT